MNRYSASEETTGNDGPRLLSYVVDLEVEVDRLRHHNRIIQEEVRKLCQAAQLALTNGNHAGCSASISAAIELLDDLRQMPEYHPADDQVTSIAIRPLAEKIFRFHQRWSKSETVVFTMNLDSEQIDWFPSRLQHILDNLFSNSLKFRDSEKLESHIVFELRTSDREWFTMRLTDNGIGMDSAELERASDLQSRADVRPRTRPEVGLAVVKRLVEQSGGAFSIESAPGMGTTVNIVLPRYDLDDFLT